MKCPGHNASHHKNLREEKIKYGVWERGLSFFINCNVLVSGIDPAVSLRVISDEMVMRSERSRYLLPSTPPSSPSAPSAQSLSKVVLRCVQVASTVFLQGIRLCCFWQWLAAETLLVRPTCVTTYDITVNGKLCRTVDEDCKPVMDNRKIKKNSVCA